MANLRASEKGLILGGKLTIHQDDAPRLLDFACCSHSPGQQLLWTEQSGPQNLEPIAWPRAAASAEVFWTGATLPSGNARNVADALPRLHDLRYRLVQRGVNAISLQPMWCALRPGACDFV